MEIVINELRAHKPGPSLGNYPQKSFLRGTARCAKPEIMCAQSLRIRAYRPDATALTTEKDSRAGSQKAVSSE